MAHPPPGPVPGPCHFHTNEVPQDMHVHSGLVPGNCFLKTRDRTLIRPTFVLECTACCWSYLCGRNYRQLNGLRMVKFDDQANTSCYVNGNRGVCGVVMTGYDLNIFPCGPRPVDHSVVYQLYGAPPGAIAIGAPMTARIEAIGVRVLTANHMKGTYLNYADAAMLEVFMEAHCLPSLKGQCCWPVTPAFNTDSGSIVARMSTMKIYN